MNIDVSLAGWILSVITFILGTIVPAIFQRFSYQGVGIKQPIDIRAVFQSLEDAKKAQIRFLAIIKIANAEKDSVLLDEIRIPSPQIRDVKFKAEKDVRLAALDLGKTIRIPFSDDPEYNQKYFPLIIKADEEEILGLEIIFHYNQGTPATY
jgi:hypothetical protein